MQNVHTATKVALAIAPQAVTAGVNGAILDRKGFGRVEFAVIAGAVTTADGSNHHDVSLIAGNDSGLSDGAAVAAADTEDGVVSVSINATTLANKFVGKIAYKGNKRYVRAVSAETGIADATFGVTAILSDPINAPVANPAA